jgi:DNA-binding NarL/FixJ family response regulator
MDSIHDARFGARMTNPGGNKRTVFLLHYHPLVREWLGRLIDLQADLAVCGEAENAWEAVGEVAGLRPDIAVIDSTLLNESAISLISDLSVAAPKMQVVVFSVYDDKEDAKQAMLAGARGYVNRSTKVIAAIRRVLEGKLFLFDAL